MGSRETETCSIRRCLFATLAAFHDSVTRVAAAECSPFVSAEVASGPKGIDKGYCAHILSGKQLRESQYTIVAFRQRTQVDIIPSFQIYIYVYNIQYRLEFCFSKDSPI